jgi:rhodanese-related sulfurtransferase
VRRLLAALALAGALLPALPAGADHAQYVPVVTIDPESLKRLLDERRPLLAVDLRPAGLYHAGRLPGARSLPAGELRARADEIPRAGLVVLYCACPFDEVNRLYQFLRARQHDNVVVLEEGFAGWLGRGYPIER